MSQGIYEGRLQTDGNGNLLADEATLVAETVIPLFLADGKPALKDDGVQMTYTSRVYEYGENHGMPVAAHDGSYVLLAPGEASHNERHHKSYVEVPATQDQDPDSPGYVDPDHPEDTPENAHHFGALDDDPHYEEGVTDQRGVVTNTHAKLDPDSTAPLVTGHTAAYKGKHENGGK